MDQNLVLNAVRTRECISVQGILQKLFAYWFDALVYDQIWEDPRVDIEALDIDENSRILTISSGGCNALNYILEDPESVTAVDLNRQHIHLLNLKIAAAKYLPSYENFFGLFGHGRCDRAGQLFDEYLARKLDPDTRKFWESNSLSGRLVYGRRIDYFIKDGLYEHSRNGHFLKFFHRYAQFIGCNPSKVLQAGSIEEQAELYKKYIDRFFDNFLFRFAGKLPLTMFGLGIPPQQFRELRKDLNAGQTIIDVYRERVRRLACDFPIAENYFAWQAFARRYDTEMRVAVPEYLKLENFERLRSAANRLTTVSDSVTNVIQQSGRNAFNRFILLDAQDWMDRSTLIELWKAIADNAEPNSRMIFRTASSNSPAETALPAGLRSRFHYEKTRSAELLKRERTALYGGFHLYVVRGSRS